MIVFGMARNWELGDYEFERGCHMFCTLIGFSLCLCAHSYGVGFVFF